MIRLSYQNKRIDKATGFYISLNQWITKKQRLIGASHDKQEINQWLDDIPGKIAGLNQRN